jgi:hypothetical protein
LGTKKFKQKNCTISKTKNWKKKVWKTKKNEKLIELFGHQKVQKVQIFWVTKKFELFGEKSSKSSESFF